MTKLCLLCLLAFAPGCASNPEQTGHNDEVILIECKEECKIEVPIPQTKESENREFLNKPFNWIMLLLLALITRD
jgi:hypothetical protein